MLEVLERNKYIDYLIEQSKVADVIRIMTFMVYVKDGGKMIELLTRLDASPCEVEIIVGIPYVFRCKPNCKDCFNQSTTQIRKLYEMADKFSNISWHFRSDVHCKMAIIETKGVRDYWYGSKNLTDGDSADLTFLITSDAQKISMLSIYEESKRKFHLLDFGKFKDKGVMLNNSSTSELFLGYIEYIYSLGFRLNCKMNTFVYCLIERILNNKRTYNGPNKDS